MNIDKMQKLLALTASDQEEEARTAAFMLCRMLREGNADLSRLTRRQTMAEQVASDVWPRSANWYARQASQARERAQRAQDERAKRWQTEAQAKRKAAAEERTRKAAAAWAKKAAAADDFKEWFDSI